jgi:hypothetical protein
LKATSIIPKWRTLTLFMRVQLLNYLLDLDEILCGADDIEGNLDTLVLIP